MAGSSLEGSTCAGRAGEEGPLPLATIAAAAVVSELSVSMSSYLPAIAVKFPFWASCVNAWGKREWIGQSLRLRPRRRETVDQGVVHAATRDRVSMVRPGLLAARVV